MIVDGVKYLTKINLQNKLLNIREKTYYIRIYIIRNESILF